MARSLTPPRRGPEQHPQRPLHPENPYGKETQVVEPVSVHDSRAPGFNSEALDELMKAAFDDGVAAEAARLLAESSRVSPLIWEDGYASGRLAGYREGRNEQQQTIGEQLRPVLAAVGNALAVVSDGKRLSAKRREELEQFLTQAVDGIAEIRPKDRAPAPGVGHLHIGMRNR